MSESAAAGSAESSEEQWLLLLKSWNQTAAEYPRDATIHGLFAQQVARTPDGVAVEFAGDRLTYRELDARAEVLASELRRKAVSAGTPVGIYVERSFDMIVGVLGILKAGGAYVPLDPHFPDQRLAFMVADAQTPVIVTQRGLVPRLPEHRAEVVCVDDLDQSPGGVENLSSSSADDLAYILYTSGSTGRPKGVPISHRSVVNLLLSTQQRPGLRPDDVLLAITTLCFDIAGLELFLPLITGAKVVIAPREVTVDGRQLAKLAEECGATFMQATPATWRMLLAAEWRGNPRLRILCGGEAFGSDLAERLLERCAEVWNGYGPTETTIYSTMACLRSGEAVTIGRPIANTQVFILDENFQRVPPGEIGELFIGGDGMARTYLNLPDITAERFVINPFVAGGHDRLYRTGDLTRFLPDGRIEYLGRTDHQVKIRGFRIELGEIEAALVREAELAQAVVVAREDSAGGKRLIAYVVAKADGAQPRAPETSALRAALRRTLPEYMVPSAFVSLPALPLTPNGKIDRSTLPAPDERPEVEGTPEAPCGEIEAQLAAIFASLFKVLHVGRHDSFFDLGGHSIMAVTLFDAIHAKFGTRLPLATLLHSATVQQLAMLVVSQDHGTSKWRPLVPLQPGGSQPRFFCVHGAGGNVLLYRDLARHLGDDQPFYGLQAQGLDGKQEPLKTVEEMARLYLGEIRELQPDGPYLLGGYCSGGTVALEIAQLLGQAGQTVALVALLDTYNFSRAANPSPLSFLRQKIAFHLGNLARMPLTQWPRYLGKKIRIAMDGELASLWKTLRTRGEPPDPSESQPETNVQAANDLAAKLYQPRPYAGRVIVFKPKVNYEFYPDPRMGWDGLLTGEVDFIDIVLNPHAMLLEPHVQSLATGLQTAIRKATEHFATAE